MTEHLLTRGHGDAGKEREGVRGRGGENVQSLPLALTGVQCPTGMGGFGV